MHRFEEVSTNSTGFPRWLNRNVMGMGVTSLLADAGYEMATTILPGFLAALNVSAAALGAIEGIADSVSSLVKLGAGWLSDRLGYRKPITVFGYFLTGTTTGLFALAQGWALVLFARVLGWLGRGIQGPLRDAMLASSVPAEERGKAFGFHRAGDTVGAIIGPLLGVILLAHLGPHPADPASRFRTVFLITLIPGLGSGIALATLVRERRAAPVQARFWASVKNLPPAFRRYLVGAGVFGMGDFARTLMILAATELLAPARGVGEAAEAAGLLYVVHNVLYAGASYPVGALSDRLGRSRLLAGGCLLGALAAGGFLAAFEWHLGSLPYLSLLFALAGISIAFVDALEGALTADLVEENLRGTAYGVLGTVNGFGDLIASLLVGTLWTSVSPVTAFGYAACLMAVGAALIAGSAELSV